MRARVCVPCARRIGRKIRLIELPGKHEKDTCAACGRRRYCTTIDGGIGGLSWQIYKIKKEMQNRDECQNQI